MLCPERFPHPGVLFPHPGLRVSTVNESDRFPHPGRLLTNELYKLRSSRRAGLLLPHPGFRFSTSYNELSLFPQPGRRFSISSMGKEDTRMGETLRTKHMYGLVSRNSTIVSNTSRGNKSMLY
jgi:hypothetical protein